jgi:hypothetical protein
VAPSSWWRRSSFSTTSLIPPLGTFSRPFQLFVPPAPSSHASVSCFLLFCLRHPGEGPPQDDVDLTPAPATPSSSSSVSMHANGKRVKVEMGTHDGRGDNTKPWFGCIFSSCGVTKKCVMWVEGRGQNQSGKSTGGMFRWTHHRWRRLSNHDPGERRPTDT